MFSCNPFWKPEFEVFPAHPTTHGIAHPLQLRTNGYPNVQFLNNLAVNQAATSHCLKLTSILKTKLSDTVRRGFYLHPKRPYAHILKAHILKAHILKAHILKAQVLKAQVLKAQVLKAQVLKTQVLKTQVLKAQVLKAREEKQLCCGL